MALQVKYTLRKLSIVTIKQFSAHFSYHVFVTELKLANYNDGYYRNKIQ